MAILLGVSIIVIRIYAPIIYKQAHYIKLSEVKQYVKDNNEYLTDVARGLLEWQDDSVETYRERNSLPDTIDTNKLYADLNVNYIYISKNHLDDNNEVDILLKNKNGNFSCGIYYSPDNVLLHWGKPQEGDRFEYEGDRHIYRSEKICDYWYYYEDDTWN